MSITCSQLTLFSLILTWKKTCRKEIQAESIYLELSGEMEILDFKCNEQHLGRDLGPKKQVSQAILEAFLKGLVTL